MVNGERSGDEMVASRDPAIGNGDRACRCGGSDVPGPRAVASLDGLFGDITATLRDIAAGPAQPGGLLDRVEVALATLREEIWRRERWLVATGEITTALLAGDASERVLPKIAGQARELAEAECALLLLPKPDQARRRSPAGPLDGSAAGPADRAAAGSAPGSTDRGVLVVAAIAAAGSLRPQPLIGAEVPISGSVSGTAFRDGVSVAVDDLSTQSPPASVSGVVFGPAVAVPLASMGATLGALTVLRAQGSVPFSTEAAAVTESFARQAALALHLAESHRTERRLAQLEDRERLALHLQDNLIQRLFAVGLLLETVIRRLDSAELRTQLDRAAQELDVTINETRETIRSLQATADPDHPALRQRLVAAIKEATACTSVRSTVHLDGPMDALVPPELADGAVEMVREAVAGVVRHGATTVSVSVVARDTLAVTVADDGASTPAGKWLRDLSAQATGFGGELTMARDGAAGRRLVWQVPLF
jgi:signal transduction histidine kinase